MTNEQIAMQFAEELDALRLKHGIADIFFVAHVNNLIVPGMVGDVKSRSDLMQQIFLQLSREVVRLCGGPESVKAGMNRRGDKDWETKNF